MLICYEDTDPTWPGRTAADADGPPVDFLVNISNDGWFNGTSEHEQHLAICRFRAVECRRSMARAVNMGISAVIDGNGRVIALPGANLGEVQADRGGADRRDPHRPAHQSVRPSGDWLPWACWLLMGIGLLRPILRRVRRTPVRLAHELA